MKDGIDFRLATREDDDELRQLLAAIPMPGSISITMRREPSYFDAAVVEGPFHQTIVAVDRNQGRIVGCASRSVRERFVNGEPQSVGYISGLRILPSYRCGSILARGFRFLRELHADRRCDFYVTTIVESNTQALDLLTSARAGLPRHFATGRFHTLAIPTAGAGREQHVVRGLVVRPAISLAEAREEPFLEFLRSEGAQRQFFSCLDSNDFLSDTGTYRGLGAEDLFLAVRGDEVVGTLGAWDQSAFRQNVVEGYSGWIRWIRPVHNLKAGLTGRPKLPEPGRPFRYVMAALPLVKSGEEAIFRPLIDAIRLKAAEAGADHVLLGLHEADPLLAGARKLATTTFTSRLSCVAWDYEEGQVPNLDARIPWLELGCL